MIDGAKSATINPGLRAVIDVGTNSVKLLMAQISGGTVLPVHEASCQTRLGAGFYTAKVLQADAIAETARVAAEFTRQARKAGAETIRMIATSAAREAINASDLISALEGASGIRLEIISGDEEAALAFAGVATDGRFGLNPMLVVDLGGGSTEFISGGGKAVFHRSFPLGVVRLSEQFRISNLPHPGELAACRRWLENYIRQEVIPALPAESAGTGLLVATGGTSTVLAQVYLGLNLFDRERIERVRLSREAVENMSARFWNMSLNSRRQVTGLPPERADIMLAGVLIYETLMNLLNIGKLACSTRGLRFGALAG